MIKIEIKNRWTGEILFEFQKENNAIKGTVEQAVRENIDLRSANLSGADLNGADLRSANLSGADLNGADLSGADLSGAYLSGADLRSADLRSADLRSADLSGADLSGAYLKVSDNKIDNTDEIIKMYEKNNNLKIKSVYINKHVIPTRYSCYWRYGLIIDEYETKEKLERMTKKQIEEALGYEIEIVGDEENE